MLEELTKYEVISNVLSNTKVVNNVFKKAINL